ncbi:M20/M25/M40 family metallo-hydrolase [Sphingobacterium sp. SRCM116780]|uniref:M20/M25/M40 family metallo-hydrolase n=1 Tax=Sphingobacterium sp. SRCM116780 TaxID=2907623 RepID=UPI001F28A437|nr:M20/M25/M40 family metallo-hydrolase [Sphingobacterium sp. SRCM116780]UIR55160.1 M20/M25/M40 family metallo-hydrolase [Sphingobacterium sp. SRCM116780]
MKLDIKFSLLVLFSILCLTTNAQYSNIALVKKHINYLANDKMKGRGTGSKEVFKAADYIEKYFKKLKLQPLGEKGFRQSFEAKVWKVKVADSIRKADNIIAFLDNDAPLTIVIGAHYDHLGTGQQGSSKDSLGVGKIHNGADDNASGVSGLLELARYYSTNNLKESYNFLFIAFGAEELGLVGSKYFTTHPTFALNKITAMLNMDMIGRLNPAQGVAVIGYGTSKKWPEIFNGIVPSIKFYTGHDGNGGSDQTSFYKKEIPVLFFHTGGHPDYHMPTDDPEKINYPGLTGIIDFEIMVINNMLKQTEKLDFQFTN